MALFGNHVDKLIRESVVDIRTLKINPKTAVVVNIDTIDGFFIQGELASPRLMQIAPNIVRVNEYFLLSHKLFFVDTHTSSSPELSTYPKHCIDENEQKIIAPLQHLTSDATIIKKNSTNAFLAKSYLKWLSENIKNIETYVITGGCTDICVMQYALTQKAYLNDNNLRAAIVVVENAVQTFDGPAHDGNMMHNFALYNMYINGITLAQI